MYPAQKIYGNKYKAGTSKVSDQKLTVSKNIDSSSLEDYVMDPEYPFVVCTISGGDSIKQRNLEVEKVSAIVKWCREYLCVSDNEANLYKEEFDFWHNGMFIISPHHEQINLIKERLSQINVNGIALNKDAFVDTVDKMQGQQADIGIVSYGVTDIEKALLEKEFILNRNRLNVSITRAKKKTVLFLSEVLTSKNFDLLDETDEKLLQGIEFVNSIEEFARRQDNRTECTSKEFNYGDVVIMVSRKRYV